MQIDPEKSGKIRLTRSDRPGKLDELPRAGSHNVGHQQGVCLFFENSTGCYLSQVPIIDHPLDGSFGDG
ncbi:hypothetical protein AB0B66_43560, partial [Catellatospora sp. NPDC049111]|uniref:hypothetical protein n=1 Tax=Catellatospora sp. NPDC049111 TaxID=3155271 RepID=UPI0033C20B60